MGRKGSWFSTVKKVFGADSKRDQKHQSNSQNHKSKLACFGHHDHQHEAGQEGATVTIVPSLPRKREKRPKIVEENEQNKQTLSLVLATAVAAGAAVAAAAEVSRLKGTPRSAGKMKREVAATKIQTAFRGYLARRKLRGLRGLARLKTLVQGQSVKRQSATTLQCMQTLSKLQSQVRARTMRMSEENQALQRQLQQKREKEMEKLQASQEKWDDSLQSKEQIEARLFNKHVAAMRREKALAYSMTHQQTWRNPSKSVNATFMDPNNPHWGWNWLERWMAARPWEGQNTMQHNQNSRAKNEAARSTMSVGEITKLYTHRDQNQDLNNDSNNTSSGQKLSRTAPSMQASSKSTPAFAARSIKVSSPKVGSWGSDSDSKKYTFGIKPERNRRHSFAGSPVKDDESFTSSPTVASTPRVAATKGKPRVQSSPSSVLSKKSVETTKSDKKEVSVSAKKRLSLPTSPAASSRRLSVSSKVGIASNKKNVSANNSDERRK